MAALQSTRSQAGRSTRQQHMFELHALAATKLRQHDGLRTWEPAQTEDLSTCAERRSPLLGMKLWVEPPMMLTTGTGAAALVTVMLVLALWASQLVTVRVMV